jgi:hypothetical protein
MSNERASEGNEWSEISMYNAAACQVAASGWVVQLVFSDVMPGAAEGGRAKELPRLAVGVPWSLAKIVHRVLGAAIERYEGQEGEISVPRSIQDQLDRQLANVRGEDKGAVE